MIGALAFFILAPVCLLVGAWGLGMTLAGVVKRRQAWTVRGLALVCGALGLGAYVWGVALVGVTRSEAMEGNASTPAQECLPADGGMVTGHRTGYFPLRFDCVLEDGTAYSAGVVSWWLTPIAVVLTAAGAGLWMDQRRRSTERVG